MSNLKWGLLSLLREKTFQQKVTLFMGDGPSFFLKKRHLKKIISFWFSEQGDARNTWFLWGDGFKYALLSEWDYDWANTREILRRYVQDLPRRTDLVSWPKEWKRGNRTGGTKSVSSSGKRAVGKRVVMFSSAMDTQSTMEKWAHRKKSGRCGV
jgi:hypothetical protein